MTGYVFQNETISNENYSYSSKNVKVALNTEDFKYEKCQNDELILTLNNGGNRYELSLAKPDSQIYSKFIKNDETFCISDEEALEIWNTEMNFHRFDIYAYKIRRCIINATPKPVPEHMPEYKPKLKVLKVSVNEPGKKKTLTISYDKVAEGTIHIESDGNCTTEKVSSDFANNMLMAWVNFLCTKDINNKDVQSHAKIILDNY